MSCRLCVVLLAGCNVDYPWQGQGSYQVLVVGCCTPNRVIMGLTPTPASFFGHLPNKLYARPDWRYAKPWSVIP